MIETEVEGSPAAVDRAAAWLRDSLRARVDDASENVIRAKRIAGGEWLGESGDAYVGYAKDIVKVTDAHVERVQRAAGKFDSYSSRLRRIQDRMLGLRAEARGGGLTVNGTIIEPPAAATAPRPPTGDLTPAQSDQYDSDIAAFNDQVDKINLYNRISGDVEDEWDSFVDWIDANLSPVAKALDEPAVDKLMSFVQENAGNLAISYALTHGERSLQKRSTKLLALAEELRSARRSGHPARRSRGNAPDAPDKIRDWKSRARLFGRGSKLLGPLGAGIEVWSALESDSPGGGLVAAGVGVGLGALVIATAPVTVPTALAVAGAVAVGAGATWLVSDGWDALPDDWTEPVDDWVGDRWDDTKDTASDAWDTVTGWF